MFKPLPMKRAELSVLKDDAPQAALLLANYGNFDPEFSEVSPEQFPELPGEAYRQVYTETRTHLDKILSHYEITPPSAVDAPTQPVAPQQLAEIAAWLRSVWEHCSEQQERMRGLREESRHMAQQLKALDQFMNISIDLALLQKKSALLDVRVGMLPRANLQRFEEALGLAGYVAIPFFSNEEQLAHLIIAGPTGQSQEIERMLQAASWRTLDVPAEFHGRPEEVRQDLTARLASMNGQMAQEDAQRRAEPAQENLRERLLEASSTLARAAPYAELAALMPGRGSLATMSGWVPNERLPQLRQLLTQTFDDRFMLRTRDPRPDERIQVPSAIRHHRWLQPFARLVLNYGVPRYGEIDPTVLFAISFVLMFGMMFGDVGHGAVIALASTLLHRRLGHYTVLGIAVGVSSMFFGLLYGSVFGFEHVLPPLWMSPLSDPMRMLGVALAWGIAFILLATALTIRNRIAEGRLHEALLCSPGAAGLLLYLGLLFATWGYATTGAAGLLPLIAIVAALAAILGYSWQHNRDAVLGERVLIALMEGFESVMAYISNTLSFLRLAAFSLNHVALSIAIFTVANMLHTTGYWLTVVLGNAFILVLEGAIVAIQTLRLEYYEGFSRFFGGDGRAFRPLTLGGKRELAIKI
ncbi:MAG TPA: V-type ATPase 116kDa subunit family protein [Gallionella sp.]|nr:V-type ATPase 116kDa subunit family protein [Gallionella sp.]